MFTQRPKSLSPKAKFRPILCSQASISLVFIRSGTSTHYKSMGQKEVFSDKPIIDPPEVWKQEPRFGVWMFYDYVTS